MIADSIIISSNSKLKYCRCGHCDIKYDNFFPSITCYTLSGQIIASGNCSNCQDASKILKQIKAFHNISKKNPYKFSFIPFNTDIKLEFFHDLICSNYGTEFTIIYEKINIDEYLNINTFTRCEDYYESVDYGNIYFDCYCNLCSYEKKKMESNDEFNKRVEEYKLKHEIIES